MGKKVLIFLSGFFIFLFILGNQTIVRGDTNYVGSETCKGCHEDRFGSYMESTHGIKADPRTPAAKQACESCHGPGGAHVNAGGGKGVGGIIPLSPESTIPMEKKNAPCLECHSKGKVIMWSGSSHESRGLSCSNCHSIHSNYPQNLSKASQSEVCTQCHKQIKSQLLKSSHHPIREGKMNCSDCHNPHGTVGEKLISANAVNEKCYQCHAEKRGPFLWEHAPVTENCNVCHTPHGSNHNKLLVAKNPFICQTCHSNSRHPGTLYALKSTDPAGASVYTYQGNRLFGRACLNCHSQIHGSNHPSGKALAR